MDNQFIQIIEQAIANRWCVEPFCTACGNIEYRRALDTIQDFTSELARLDVNELIELRNWSECLCIVFLTQGFRVNWNPVLNSWLPKIQGNIRFADHVLYKVIRYMQIRPEVAQKWIGECIRLGTETGDPSLVESLVRILGKITSEYPQLLMIALKLSNQFPLVRNALVRAGFLPSKEELRYQEKRKREAKKATRNLFGAIRRNDIKAVVALLKRDPDLSARNDDNQTPFEYACSVGRADIGELLITKTQGLP